MHSKVNFTIDIDRVSMIVKFLKSTMFRGRIMSGAQEEVKNTF